MTERTLIIFKPDAIQRGIIGEIITRFERTGLKMIAAKMLNPDYEHYHKHYEGIGKMISRRGEKPFQMVLELMQMGPVFAMIWEGVEAVEVVRKLVGPTEPKSAPPGTIRGDYAHISFSHADEASVGVGNIVHASGDPTEAKEEIAHWFKDEEIYEYDTTSEYYTQGKKKK